MKNEKLEELAKEQRRLGKKCVFLDQSICRPDLLKVYDSCYKNYTTCFYYKSYVRHFINSEVELKWGLKKWWRISIIL